MHRFRRCGYQRNVILANVGTLCTIAGPFQMRHVWLMTNVASEGSLGSILHKISTLHFFNLKFKIWDLMQNYCTLLFTLAKLVFNLAILDIH